MPNFFGGGGGAGNPAGSDGDLQINNGGVFAGVSPGDDGDYLASDAGAWTVTTPGLAGRTDADGTITLTEADNNKLVTVSNGTSNAVTNDGTVAANDIFRVLNASAGTMTFTPLSGTVNGSADIDCDTQWSRLDLRFDGTNWTASCILPIVTPTPPAGSGTELQYRASATTFGAAAGTTWDNTNRDLTWAQGTITTSNPYISHSATWNDAGVAFEGYTSNITVTAAQDSVEPPSTATGSDYWNLKVGSVKRWAFQYDATAGFNSALIGWNAAGTASVRMFEWGGASSSAAVLRLFGGSTTNASLTLQADAGSGASAGAQAMRFGLVANGVSNVVGNFGGDSDGAGSPLIWVNRSGNSDPRLCMGKMTDAECVAATGKGDIFIKDTTAAFSTTVTIEAGASQGTDNILNINNNAGSGLLFRIGPAGEIQTAGRALASLGTPANGTMEYCTDCLKGSDPCTASSTGAMAMRVAGAWQCM